MYRDRLRRSRWERSHGFSSRQQRSRFYCLMGGSNRDLITHGLAVWWVCQCEARWEVPMGELQLQVWECVGWVTDECITGGASLPQFPARPNAETDNSLIPRPSGRFPSSGSVLDETFAVVRRCRGGDNEGQNSGKLTTPSKLLTMRCGESEWRTVNDMDESSRDRRESYAMKVWVRDEKFDKFIKSTKSNAIIHHHVPYLFPSVKHRYKIIFFLFDEDFISFWLFHGARVEDLTTTVLFN